MDGPPSPASEDDPEDKFSMVRRSRHYEEVDETVSVPSTSLSAPQAAGFCAAC